MALIHPLCLDETRLKGTDVTFFSLIGCTLCKTKYTTARRLETPFVDSLSPRKRIFVNLALYSAKTALRALLFGLLLGFIPLDLTRLVSSASKVSNYIYLNYYLLDEGNNATLLLDGAVDDLGMVLLPPLVHVVNKTLGVSNSSVYQNMTSIDGAGWAYWKGHVARGATLATTLLGSVKFMTLGVIEAVLRFRLLPTLFSGRKKKADGDFGMVLLIMLVLFLVTGLVTLTWQFVKGFWETARDKIVMANMQSRKEHVEMYRVLDKGGDKEDKKDK
jgi:hypothetical protein